MEIAYILGRKQEDFEGGRDDGTVCYRGIRIGHGDIWGYTGIDWTVRRQYNNSINPHDPCASKMAANKK